MDKCYFNSCVLNDKEKLIKYKQHNRNIKKKINKTNFYHGKMF